MIQEQVGILEVNISCPNVHGGGMSFGTDPARRRRGHARGEGRLQKAGLRQADAQRDGHCRHCQAPARQAGADGLSLINTLLGMRIDLRTPQTRASPT